MQIHGNEGARMCPVVYMARRAHAPSGCAESILMSFLEVSGGCKISQLHCNESAQTCVGFNVRYMARRVQQRMAGAPSPLIGFLSASTSLNCFGMVKVSIMSA